LISDLQKLIPIDPAHTDLFCYKLPDSPTVELYSIRPYRNTDENIIYQICTDNHSSSEIYPGDLYADRFVGPFLTLNPEMVLVLEDSHKQICGYIAVESEISTFYRRQNMCWFETMMDKYPLSMVDDCSPRAKEILKYFHTFNHECPEIVLQSFPSILTISVLKGKYFNFAFIMHT
jgi:protein O-GlcNAcase / histone acetyltransferase